MPRRSNPTGHPARFSPEIIDLLVELLQARYPDWMGRPILWDPCAGDGLGLALVANNATAKDPDSDFTIGFDYGGTEIEAPYIVATNIVQGDATDPFSYRPAYEHPGGLVIVTSVAYPNGVADNHKPKDSSIRKTYRAVLMALTGNADYELHPNNMGGYGYRGTLRGGRSKRRQAFWELAGKMADCWGRADRLFVNVSDFKHSNGSVEPFVDDFEALLVERGWTVRRHPVGTARMRFGKNYKERVAHEVILEASRP